MWAIFTHIRWRIQTCCSHFNRCSCRAEEPLSSLTPVTGIDHFGNPPFVQRTKHEQKECVLNRGKKKLLSSCSLTGQASELRLWCDFFFFFFVVFFYFLFPLECVFLCSFILLIMSRPCAAKNAQNVSLRSTFSLSCCSLGPLQSTLGVVSLRLCPVLCLWPVLCTVVLPSYHKVPLIP